MIATPKWDASTYPYVMGQGRWRRWLQKGELPFPFAPEEMFNREAARALRSGQAIADPTVAHAARIQQRFLNFVAMTLVVGWLALLAGSATWVTFWVWLALTVIFWLWNIRGIQTMRATNRYQAGH